LAAWIEAGMISGITSNPTIFHAAIANSQDYDAGIAALSWAGRDADGIFWELAIEDIRDACDLFMPLYNATRGAVGYVSLEEDPAIARDAKAAIAQAAQLWARVARPNLLVKIPATAQAMPAIRSSIAAGVNVNVTLIFSLGRYAEVIEAYLGGLEERLSNGLPIEHLASVASFFISRVDTKIDAQLPAGSHLRGRAAIANARLAYEMFRQTFSGQRWERLRAAGARLQRPLWASTSTKNPAYSDTRYVDELIGADTINTMPLETLAAVQDHGSPQSSIALDVEGARTTIRDLAAAGISYERLTQELEDEGVLAFQKSWNSLIEVIETRRVDALAQLGPLANPVRQRFARLKAESTALRFWNRDPSLWSADPAQQREISTRLGWLDLPTSSRVAAAETSEFARQMHRAGNRKYLLLGMGGSALAAEAFWKASAPDGNAFASLDSTDPDQILAANKAFPADETLFIVSSKSGSTTEVNALFDFYYQQAAGDGSRFIAITDPGTALETLAENRKFRKTFQARPDVGGRYSALSHFGMLPAAFIGLDPHKLLASAASMQRQCAGNTSAERNPGLALGAVLGQSALAGRDKLVILADETLIGFGAWLEQLIAESTGKSGKGILAAQAGSIPRLIDRADDRLFVYLRSDGSLDEPCSALRKAGYPVIESRASDAYALAAEMYRWEYATAIACHILGVNAFDQPDVQDSKTRTQAKLVEYAETGRLDLPFASVSDRGTRLCSNPDLGTVELGPALLRFLGWARSTDYVAINAYLPRAQGMLGPLEELRVAIEQRTGCVAAGGYGPRYLHSTGQLQKGGPENGLFLQITADREHDLQVPTQELSFRVIQQAQAFGDYAALLARGRRCLWVHLAALADVSRLLEVLR
jgi:transaldolase/glucose-6-phosphate isomerase